MIKRYVDNAFFSLPILEILKRHEISNFDEITSTYQKLLKLLIELCIERERDLYLGFKKSSQNEHKNVHNNYRNGTSKVILHSLMGDIVIYKARDRNGTFETAFLTKSKRNIALLEHTLISMCARNSDLDQSLEQMNNVTHHKLQPESLLFICDEINHTVKKTLTNTLDNYYKTIIIEKLNYNFSKEERKIVSSLIPLYLLIGINKQNRKEILGFYLIKYNNEKSWKNVFKNLKKHGVFQIDLCICKNCKCMTKAVETEFKDTKIDAC